MSEQVSADMRVADMSEHWRLILVESKRVSGTFWVQKPTRQGTTWVKAVDVTVWDEGRRSGRVFHSGDLTCGVKGDDADLHEHMIARDKLADVQDVWDEMKAVLVAAAEAGAS